jgi:dTDP-4-dehydrorhamnose reductase
MSFSSFEPLDQSKLILMFGLDGQVGRALQDCLRDFKVPAVFLGRSDCDLSNEFSIREVLNHYQPQVIVNAAAYTAVDRAESEREAAFAINAQAPQVMAHYIANVAHGIFVHYSTDYVFADTKKTPYLETDITGPMEQLCIYGQSKLAGEQAIQKVFALAQGSQDVSDQNEDSRYYILRTSWVYGDGGNFIKTMLRLASERDELKVVADQIGVPSSATWLAEIGVQLAGSQVESGIYHAVPDGETSWHGLAVLVIKTAIECGKDVKVNLKNILPILTQDYPLPAKRPYNSRLSNQKLKEALFKMGFKGQYPYWEASVQQYVKELCS